MSYPTDPASYRETVRRFVLGTRVNEAMEAENGPEGAGVIYLRAYLAGYWPTCRFCGEESTPEHFHVRNYSSHEVYGE